MPDADRNDVSAGPRLPSSLAKLLARPEGFELLVNTMADGLFTLDLACHITYWNKAAERITGYGAQEAIGRHCSFLEGEHCADARGGGQPRCPVFLQGEVRNGECRIRGKDGQRIDILKNARLLRDASGQVIGAVENFADVSDLRAAQSEAAHLRSKLQDQHQLGDLVGKSHQMQEIFDLVRVVADSNASVLIQGESGTGKDLIARAIHAESPRHDGPLVKVNCSALAETLLESELFGHVRGAFTGATRDKVGRFEAADGGTIFLDEIGDMSRYVQLKLLRVIQEKEFERVGESQPCSTDARVLAATNKDLAEQVRQGTFREDLYYRLKVIVITVPPLRERKEDIPLLTHHFVRRFRHETGKAIDGCGSDALVALLDYDWPGNVRELEHAIEHAFVTCRRGLISIFDLPRELRQSQLARRNGAPSIGRRRPPNSRKAILAALKQARWNRAQAARQLGMSRTTLWKRIRALGLKPE